MPSTRFGRWLAAAVVALGLLAAAVPARALVLHSDDEPAAHPADAVIGRWSTNASCVAIGPDLVITTRHQGGGIGSTVTLDGIAYTVADVFEHTSMDLRIARLSVTSPLVYAALADTTAETAFPLVIGGYGKGRGAALASNGTTYAYAWAGAANDTLRWGSNRIDSLSGDYLTADFDGASTGTDVPYESIIAEWDSGGGWFVKVADEWRLAGLSHGVSRIGQSRFRDPVTLVAAPDLMDAVRLSTFDGWIDGVVDRRTWTGAVNALWSTAGNWDGGDPDARDAWAIFDGASPGTVTVSGSISVGAIRLDGASPYTFASGGGFSWLSMDTSAGPALIECRGAATQTFTTPIRLQDDTVVSVAGGGTIALNGAVSQAKKLTKRGGGLLTLGGSNSFGGGVDIEAGTVRATAAFGLGTGTATLLGGTLELVRDAATSFPNDLYVSGDGTVHVGGSGAPAVHSMGGLTLEPHRLTVTGAGGYGLRFIGSTLVKNNIDPAVIDTAGADVSLEGSITLEGRLTKAGPGELAFVGSGYAVGHTLAVEDGTLRFGLPGGSVTLGTGADLVITGAGTVLAGGAADPFTDTGSGERMAVVNDSVATFRVTAGAKEVKSVDTSGAAGALLGRTVVDAGASLGAAYVRQASLEVEGALALRAGGGTSRVEGLTLGASGRLDLADNALVVDYAPGSSPVGSVAAWVAAAYADGAWDGPGLGSSVAAGEPMMGVGYADNADLELASFAGEDVDESSVLVAYTLLGDVNLDGLVSGVDLNALLINWGASGRQWGAGDFDYDGKVTGTDLNALLINWGKRYDLPTGTVLQTPLAPPDLEGFEGVLVAPEPATLALVAAGLGALALGRRRR